MFKELHQLITHLKGSQISEKRKIILNNLIETLQKKRSENKEIRLNFICTHNSRRSHLAQIWAQTMAFYFKINAVTCYSGGTEATAIHPNIIFILKENGFNTIKLSEDENPVYAIKYGKNEPAIIAFSKEIHHPFNPANEFIAVLTCTDADENCPVVLGAKKRISLPFEDPKKYDNTLLQHQKYIERSLQIAKEMYYVFSKITY